jgi:hypothetical protein
MALGALVIIAVLVAGSSYVSMQEARLGQNSLIQSRAFAAAEYGLNRIQADWDRTPNLQMATGGKFDTTYTLPGQEVAKVRYVRLNDETFWIVSEGRAYVGNSQTANRQAVKRVGAVLRLRIPTIDAKGAITAGGDVTVKGAANVNGRDSVPASWGCDTLALPPDDKPGIVVPPGDTVKLQGSGSVLGDPAFTTDSVAGKAETYFGFGEENWQSLIQQANWRLTSKNPTNVPSPVADAQGYCDKTKSWNWGEPKRPATLDGGETLVPDCYNYFPIIYAPYGLELQGNGRGQGILLVQGDLVINGTFDWYGVVVVTQNIIRGNGSAQIMGAVMAANETVAEGSMISGTTNYNYSSCSIARALRGSAQVVQAKHRAWAELY